MGGVRPDGLRWHPEGLAVDDDPQSGSAEGIALGNQIVAYVLKNAERFGIQDAIWRGVYYTPSGPLMEALRAISTTYVAHDDRRWVSDR